MPLAESAGFLRVKTGMATGICYNWYFKQKPTDPSNINIEILTIKDIGIKSYYSDQT